MTVPAVLAPSVTKIHAKMHAFIARHHKCATWNVFGTGKFIAGTTAWNNMLLAAQASAMIQ
jgi:hypothetical protein